MSVEGEIGIGIPVEANCVYEIEMTLHFGAPAPRVMCAEHLREREHLHDHKKARIKRMHQLYARRRR